MTTIKFKEEDWGILSPKERAPQFRNDYQWLEYDIQLTSSGRYAAFKLQKRTRLERTYILYVVDLLTRKITHYPKNDSGEPFKGDGFVFYWLSDFEMMVHFANDEMHIQCLLAVDHVKKQLYELAKSKEFTPDFRICYCTDNGAPRFVFRNTEYLLVSGDKKCLLRPYRLNKNGEGLKPTIRIELWSNIAEPIADCKINYALAFGYKEKLYYILESEELYRNRNAYSETFFDRFLCIDLRSQRMENGVIGIRNKEDGIFFYPKKIGPGIFKTELKCSASQQEHIIIISEHFYVLRKEKGKQGRKFWILNMEEETIQELLVTSNKLSKVTLYQSDSLMLWSIPDHWYYTKESQRALKCKPIPRNDIVARLKTICVIKMLLSQRPEHRRFARRFMFS